MTPDAQATARYAFLHEGILCGYLSKLGRQAKDAAIYWKYGCWFYEQTTDMLRYMNDVLHPHGFDDIVKDDFASLRQMLQQTALMIVPPCSPSTFRLRLFRPTLETGSPPLGVRRNLLPNFKPQNIGFVL